MKVNISLNKLRVLPVDCAGQLPNITSNTMKTKLLIASLGAAVALAITPAHAAKPKGPETPAPTPAKTEPAAEKGKNHPTSGTVVAVTPKLLTLNGAKGKEDRKFDITADTKIVNGDKPATIADVKVGSKIGGYVKPSGGTGNDVILKINVGVNQEPKGKGEGDAKKKAK